MKRIASGLILFLFWVQGCVPTGKTTATSLTSIPTFIPTLTLVGSSAVAPIVATLSGKIILISHVEYPENRIFVMNANGSDLMDITPPNLLSIADPTWSPDGNSIVFSALKEKSHIFKMKPDGSDLIQLTTDDTWGSRPSWSPDGANIMFTSSAPDIISFWGRPAPQIYMMKSDGSEVHRLLVKTKDENTPMIGYFRQDGLISVSEIITRYAYLNYIVDLSGEIQVQFQEFSSYEIPVWSPDGKSYLFPTNLRNLDCPGMEVKIMGNADPSCLTMGTRADPPIFLSNPSWSPDGQYIAFSSNMVNGNIANIYVVKLDGSDLMRLIDLPGGVEDWE